MALAAISGILSTTVLGGIILAIVVLILRSMWKKKKAGGSCGCGCGCSGCVQALSKGMVKYLHICY